MSKTVHVIYIQDNDVDEIGSPGWQVHPAIAHEHGRDDGLSSPFRLTG